MKSQDFIDFLAKAKKNTYASGQNKVTSPRPGAIDLAYGEGDYKYVDSYFGGILFSGQEVVYKQDTPVWSMNYYGKTMKENLPPEFNITLKEALVLVDETSPFRGPEYYKREDFEYKCQCNGSVEFFHGKEYILYKGEEVYRLYFHGGMVK